MRRATFCALLLAVTALARARAHIAAGTDYTPEEWTAEVKRARVAGLPGNACWSYRTPSPLSLEQVRANDYLGASLRNDGEILKLINSRLRALLQD